MSSVHERVREGIVRWSDPITVSQLKAEGKRTAAHVLARLFTLTTPIDGQRKKKKYTHTHSCPRKTDPGPPQKICAKEHQLTSALLPAFITWTGPELNLLKVISKGLFLWIWLLSTQSVNSLPDAKPSATVFCNLLSSSMLFFFLKKRSKGTQGQRRRLHPSSWLMQRGRLKEGREFEHVTLYFHTEAKWKIPLTLSQNDVTDYNQKQLRGLLSVSCSVLYHCSSCSDSLMVAFRPWSQPADAPCLCVCVCTGGGCFKV